MENNFPRRDCHSRGGGSVFSPHQQHNGGSSAAAVAPRVSPLLASTSSISSNSNSNNNNNNNNSLGEASTSSSSRSRRPKMETQKEKELRGKAHQYYKALPPALTPAPLSTLANASCCSSSSAVGAAALADKQFVYQNPDHCASSFPTFEHIRRQGKLCDVTLKVSLCICRYVCVRWVCVCEAMSQYNLEIPGDMRARANSSI